MKKNSTSEHPQLNEYTVLTFISLIGAFLFFFRIGNQSLWLDEALTLNIAENWHHMWQILTQTEPYMWTYIILLHFWMKLGMTESFLRSLSALFGVATVPMVFLLGRKLFTPAVGLLSAFLISINTFFIRYAQEIRAYSLLVFITTVLSYIYVRLIEKPTITRRVLYIVLSSLSIYTHQFAIFIILSQSLSLFFIYKWRRALRFLFPIVVGVELLCLPLIFIRVPLLGSTSWIDLPQSSDIYNLVVALAGGNQFLFFLESFVIVYGFIYIWKINNDRQRRQEWSYIFTLCLLLLPIIVVIAVSYVYKPIFVPRYLIIILVPFILLTSKGLMSLGRPPRYIILTIVLICSTMVSAQWYGLRKFDNTPNTMLLPKDDWRGATNYVLTHSSKSDAVIFFPYYVQAPFNYYVHQFAKNKVVSSLPSILELASQPYTVDGKTPRPNEALIREFNQRYQYVWLILSHNSSIKLGRNTQTKQIENLIEHYCEKGIYIQFTFVNVIKYTCR